MNPKEVLGSLGRACLRHYGDEATLRFFDHLKAREFKSTRCVSCRRIGYPPRSFCPFCGKGEIEWVDLPRSGKLYAFSQQDRALRFTKPDVLGLVELRGVGHILTKIAAPMETLRIGLPVRLDFIEIEGEIVLHQFKAVGGQG